MDAQQIKNILEACLLVAAKPLSIKQLETLFVDDGTRPDKKTLKAALATLQEDYTGRGIELVEVGSGYRLQSRSEMAEWIGRLFDEKPPRYSRALLETLVLVAYRQPITRGEIEEVRGVAVSSNIIKTLQERQWIAEVGVKDVPGKPALFGTTKQFLDYFNLQRLDELPAIADIQDLDQLDAILTQSVGVVDAQMQGTAANETDQAATENGASDAEVEGSALHPSDAESVAPVLVGPLLAHGVAEATADQIDATQAAAEDGSQATAADNASAELTGVESMSAESTGAESELRRVIDAFAEEHQEEVDQRRHIDAQNLSADVDTAAAEDSTDESAAEEPTTEEAAAEDAEYGDGDEVVADDMALPFTGDPPEPGDTLH